MNYYVVIDTNVLVSAMLRWDSIPGNIMELVFNGSMIPLVNQEIIDEYREVLSRPRFQLDQSIIDDVIVTIEENAVYVDAKRLNVEMPDPKDRIFYEIVVEKRKQDDAYLVTGNSKHFPSEPFILTPREFLNMVLE